MMQATIKSKIKESLLAAFPDTALRFFSKRSRKWIENHAKRHGLYELALAVSKKTDSKVLSGPFRGMMLDYGYLPVNSAPKFLGTYEKEISHFVEKAIALNPKYVLNVGTSDGYYAVGLARRLPGSTVFAAEADSKSLQATLSNAKLNSVDSQVVPIGILHRGEFEKYLQRPNSLLIMDCEGAEFILLDPATDPVLLRTTMLIEIHETHGSWHEIERRFSKTHSIETAMAVARNPSDLPTEVRGSIPQDALNEHRGAQIWMFMKLRQPSAMAD